MVLSTSASRELRRKRAAVFGNAVVGEHHVLKQQRLAGVRLRLFGGELDVDHAADDVADELAIHAVIGDEAEGVGIHLVDLGEVVDDDARNQQARDSSWG